MGIKQLLDSNVIIFASKQQIDVEKLLNQYDYFYVSIITLMEVYGHQFKSVEEKDLIDNLFKYLDIIELDIEIATDVINYRKNSIKKIKLPDAIILAIAKNLKADLITDDWDDFDGIDSEIEIIKLDLFRIA